MSASVVDMTGRVLEAGETVTETLEQQQFTAAYRDFWNSVPDMVRYLADQKGFEYPDCAELIIHSLLQEAVQASEKHDRAAEVVEFIRSSFYTSDSE